jgi:hypothetical protein
LSDQEPQQTKNEPTRNNFPVYTVTGLEKEFRQSEIITSVAQYTYNPVTGRAEERYHNYIIVLAQDCDLLLDYEEREKGSDGFLNGLLVYEVETALEIKAKLPSGKDFWKMVTQNRDDRYHYLEEIPKEFDTVMEGLPALGIDFKRYFTIPPKELYRQCTLAHGARRRCRLEMPYREHLQSRAAFYFQRVMLPLPHRKPAEVEGKALLFGAANIPKSQPMGPR